MKIPRAFSSYSATLAEQYLVEALQNPTPNTPFATINETNHTALRSLSESFNIIPKVVEQQSSNINN